MIKKNDWPFETFKTIGLLLILGGSMSACSAGSVKWKEDVLLNDGKKIVVNRTHAYGGYGEIGQGRLIKEITTSFTIPDTSRIIVWKSDFGEDKENNLDLLILDVVENVPYIATHTAFLRGYVQWGRPNPPYVFFKYEDGKWKRIGIEEFPSFIKSPNLVVNTKSNEKELLNHDLVSVKQINDLNALLPTDYRILSRTPLDFGPPMKEHNSSKAPEETKP